jgi:hypothetical protein
MNLSASSKVGVPDAGAFALGWVAHESRRVNRNSRSADANRRRKSLIADLRRSIVGRASDCGEIQF